MLHDCTKIEVAQLAAECSPTQTICAALKKQKDGWYRSILPSAADSCHNVAHCCECHISVMLARKFVLPNQSTVTVAFISEVFASITMALYLPLSLGRELLQGPLIACVCGTVCQVL